MLDRAVEQNRSCNNARCPVQLPAGSHHSTGIKRDQGLFRWKRRRAKSQEIPDGQLLAGRTDANNSLMLFFKTGPSSGSVGIMVMKCSASFKVI